MANSQDASQQFAGARELLLEELTRRSRSNPRYSLRAFARTLGVTPAAVSMILSGKRKIGKKLAQKIASKLALSPMLSQALLEDCRTQKKLPEPKESDYSRLSLDHFAVISEWYHFAILSLIETKGFKPKTAWIGSRLGISHAETVSAVERLVRLKILDTTSDSWKQIGLPILVENMISTAATRQNQKQVLEKAIYSLENDPIELRDVSSMTIAIDPKQIPLAREVIKKFRVHLMNLLEGNGNAKEVYHLGVQIYPVTQTKEN